MNHKKEQMIIDKYLTDTIAILGSPPCRIEPSKRFSNRVMSEVVRCERRRGLIRASLFGLALMTPFVLREIWLFVRNDYFSTNNFPFSNAICYVYHVFLSDFAYYAILGVSLAGAGFVVWRGIRRVRQQAQQIKLA